jgi:hypothetical protein
MTLTPLMESFHILAVLLSSQKCLMVHLSPLITAALATTGLVLYLIATRLLFHPLAKVPGPRLAALTKWYEFYYDVVCDGEYVKHIEKLHIIYGMRAFSGSSRTNTDPSHDLPSSELAPTRCTSTMLGSTRELLPLHRPFLSPSFSTHLSESGTRLEP